MSTRRGEWHEPAASRDGTPDRGYKPGFLMMLLPAILLLGFIFLMVVGGWALWLFLPVVALVVILMAVAYFRNKPGRKVDA